MIIIHSRGAHKSGERWKHEGREGFRQVWASVRIITLCLVFWCIMIHWVDTPVPLLLYAKGLGFKKKIQVGYNLSDRDSICTCLFYKIYLLNIFPSPVSPVPMVPNLIREELTKPRDHGGWGFTDTRLMNECFLAKWIIKLEGGGEDL
jgi:hypothetical protein